jgi:catabolite regulation protein CreA
MQQDVTDTFATGHPFQSIGDARLIGCHKKVRQSHVSQKPRWSADQRHRSADRERNTTTHFAFHQKIGCGKGKSHISLVPLAQAIWLRDRRIDRFSYLHVNLVVL